MFSSHNTVVLWEENTPEDGSRPRRWSEDGFSLYGVGKDWKSNDWKGKDWKSNDWKSKAGKRTSPPSATQTSLPQTKLMVQARQSIEFEGQKIGGGAAPGGRRRRRGRGRAGRNKAAQVRSAAETEPLALELLLVRVKGGRRGGSSKKGGGEKEEVYNFGNRLDKVEAERLKESVLAGTLGQGDPADEEPFDGAVLVNYFQAGASSSSRAPAGSNRRGKKRTLFPPSCSA